MVIRVPGGTFLPRRFDPAIVRRNRLLTSGLQEDAGEGGCSCLVEIDDGT